ncbi:MAG: hypothetical protein AB9842_08150 [Bacteroidales bacterium]
MKKIIAFLSMLTIFLTVIVTFPSTASPPGEKSPVLYASADVQQPAVSPGSMEMEAVKPMPVTMIDSNTGVDIDSTLTQILDEIKTIPKQDPNGLFGVGWDWLKTVYILIYLLIGMLYPTSKEWDFLLWPLKILQKFIPNISSGGGTHVSTLWQDIKAWLNNL